MALRIDNTRAQRAARRQALLDVAAHRMGVPSWSTLEKSFRAAVETGGTDAEVNGNIEAVLISLHGCIFAGTHTPPADVLAALNAHPRKKEIWTAEKILQREG